MQSGTPIHIECKGSPSQVNPPGNGQKQKKNEAGRSKVYVTWLWAQQGNPRQGKKRYMPNVLHGHIILACDEKLWYSRMGGKSKFLLQDIQNVNRRGETLCGSCPKKAGTSKLKPSFEDMQMSPVHKNILLHPSGSSCCMVSVPCNGIAVAVVDSILGIISFNSKLNVVSLILKKSNFLTFRLIQLLLSAFETSLSALKSL